MKGDKMTKIFRYKRITNLKMEIEELKSEGE